MQANRITDRPFGRTRYLPEYRSWLGMRQRCFQPNNPAYPGYGGRGITVCPEWSDFAAFYRDMGPRPSPTHSLDRIDNDGPYSRENCRWATKSEQARNRRSNRLLTLNGETMLQSDWAKRLGVEDRRLEHRLSLGWTVERVLTQPFRKSPTKRQH